MGIVKDICDKYPCEVFLNNATELHCKINWEGDYLDGFIPRMEKVLKNVFGITTGLSAAAAITVSRENKDGHYISVKSYGDRKVFIQNDRSEDTLPWVIYYLLTVAKNSWFEECFGKVVSTKLYYAPQQYCANVLGKEIGKQFQSNQSIELEKKLIEEVERAMKSLDYLTPYFAESPVTEAGWSIITKFFPQKRKVSLKQLASELFDFKGVKEHYHSWESCFKTHSSIKSASDEISDAMTDILWQYPMLGVKSAIDDAQRKLLEKSSPDVRNRLLEGAESEMKTQVQIKRVSQDELSTIFKTVSEKLRTAAKLKILEYIAKIALDRLKQSAESTVEQAREPLQELRREVSSFCRLRKDCYDYATAKLSWCNAKELSFEKRSSVWTVDTLRDLTERADEFGDIVAWLVSPETMNLSGVSELPSRHSLKEVSVTDRGFALSVCCSSMLTGGDNG